jgi:hypothetical protein
LVITNEEAVAPTTVLQELPASVLTSHAYEPTFEAATLKVAVPFAAQVDWLLGCVAIATGAVTVKVAALLDKKKFKTQRNLTPLFANVIPDTFRVA